LTRQTNLANSQTVLDALARKLASLASAVAGPSTEPAYVDRAAARREAFNQPEKPQIASTSNNKRRKTTQEPQPVAAAPPKKDGRTAIEEDNVGAKMLEKMVSPPSCRFEISS
jgi:hypothetical protein